MDAESLSCLPEEYKDLFNTIESLTTEESRKSPEVWSPHFSRQGNKLVVEWDILAKNLGFIPCSCHMRQASPSRFSEVELWGIVATTFNQLFHTDEVVLIHDGGRNDEFRKFTFVKGEKGTIWDLYPKGDPCDNYPRITDLLDWKGKTTSYQEVESK